MTEARHHFRLEVPAEAEFLHLIRLGTAGVAGEAGLSLDEIDDLRIAVDEVSTALIEAGDVSALEFAFEVGDGELRLDARRVGDFSEYQGVDELVETILDATVDEYDAAFSATEFVVRIRKNRR